MLLQLENVVLMFDVCSVWSFARDLSLIMGVFTCTDVVAVVVECCASKVLGDALGHFSYQLVVEGYVSFSSRLIY